MKIKLFTTRKSPTIERAISNSKEYFGGNITFSELNIVKEKVERNKNLYDIAMSWAALILKETKSISNEHLKSYDIEGYDGMILFLDKGKAKESSSLFGQHHYENGKCYIEIYDTNRYIKIGQNEKQYVEIQTSNKNGAIEEATSRVLKHEIKHAISKFYGIIDLLHVFISENLFENYLYYLQTNIANQMETNAEKLYKKAMSWLKKDITPKDEIPDSVACAITVNAIHQDTFGDPIGGYASTYLLYDALTKRKDFQKVDAPQRGDIIISPTGYAGKGGTLTNGHVGIVGDGGVVLSNNSNTGLLETYFTLQKWSDYYGKKGKFPIYYFRKK